MSDEIIEIAGERFGLGLNLPPDEIRPLTFAPLPDKFLLTKAQIEDAVKNPNRTPRRQLFAGKSWIFSQGNVGSCNAYSQIGALMRARHLRNLTYVKLSGSGFYAYMNDGVDRGSGLEEGRVLLETVGPPEALGLADGAFYRYRDIPHEKRASGKRWLCKTYRVDNEDQLASGLAQDMIAVVAVTAGNSYTKLDANGVRGGGGGKGNHSVGACDVRVRNGVYEFDEFGSWGLRNGEGGYAWLQWKKHLETPNRYHSFFLIYDVIDDPAAANPKMQ